MFRRSHTLFLLLSLVLLAACGGGATNEPAAGGITIEEAWARPPVMAGGNGAAYFLVRNDGDTADRLIAVTSPLAMAEMHESVMAEDGTMAMNPVDGVDVPANSSVAFERGGLHIMFMGVAEPPAVGDTVSLTLTFENAGEITIDVPVRAE
jgi:copper(I)-binding protein